MKTPHLTQDQLMQAATDQTQLPPQVQAHFSTCQTCQEAQDKLSHRLGGLKNLSRRISGRSSRLWRGASESDSPRPFTFKFMLIVALVIGLILLINIYDPFGFKRRKEVRSNQSVESIAPITDIYAGLLTPWWHNEIRITRLNLTPDEIQKLDADWQIFSQETTDLKKKLLDGQVALAIGMEKKDWDQAGVRRQYEHLSQAFSRLTDERFTFLLKTRALLGEERFQELLRLQKLVR